MKITLEMKLLQKAEGQAELEYSHDTIVTFDNIPDPLNVYALLDYFVRFAEAADYMRMNIYTAMFELAATELPPEVQVDDSDGHITKIDESEMKSGIICDCGHRLDEHFSVNCSCDCELSKNAVEARYWVRHYYREYQRLLKEYERMKLEA